MKNKVINSIIYAICLGSLLTATSCKKYLEIDNPLTMSQDQAFATIEGAELSVVGVYAELPGDAGYGSRLSLAMPYGADDFKISGAWNEDEARGISHYGAGTRNREIKDPFNQLYSGIERANIAIKYIPASPAFTGGSAEDQTKMKKLLGEALTLRALFYHELIRNWGDVPVQFIPSADLTDLYLPKTDRDAIYEHLLEDLKTAEEYVPWRTETSENMPTRITKAAVKGLRARLALARGGYSLRRESNKMERRNDYLDYYTIARNECKEIIQKQGEHNLNPVFEDVFKALHRTQSVESAHEILFAVGAAGAAGATNTKLGYGNGIRILQGNTTYGRANGALEAVSTYFYEFDKQDLRRDVTIAIYQIDATDKKELPGARVFRDGKFRKYWTNIRDASQNLGINWPILRYADVLLMFAEAENELNGPSGDAVEAFSKVRERAFAVSERAVNVTGYIATASASKNAFRAAIKQERLLELGGEGIRKYDLIRWNDLASNIVETRAKLTAFRDGTGAYANVPNVIYYKKTNFANAQTVYQELTSLDLFGGNLNEVAFKPNLQAATPAGYTSVSWRDALKNTTTPNLYIEGSEGLANKFVENHSELLPIHQDIINENYNLKQDYGY